MNPWELKCLYIWIVFTLFGPYFHNFYQYYQQYFDQTIGYLTRYYYSCSEFFFPSINNLHKTSGSGLKIISVFLPSIKQVFFLCFVFEFHSTRGQFFSEIATMKPSVKNKFLCVCNRARYLKISFPLFRIYKKKHNFFLRSLI